MKVVRAALASATLAATVLAVSSILLPPPAMAHHGWSGYDSSKPQNLTGTVQEVAFSNPHTVIMLKTGDKTWHVVLAPPSRMTTRGLPDGTLKAGQTVTVTGYASLSDAAELRAERISLDGKTVELR